MSSTSLQKWRTLCEVPRRVHRHILLRLFAAVGSAMASRKMVSDAATDPSTLVAIAFALSVAVYICANISGGHINPTVTFGTRLAATSASP
ncbi:tonoplast intrinsic protein 5;1 [Actinidia rufa]|uniref:Tonoplast intrinsic protein 51 n=1 Tax=Actinidia rufa TaxID=165716 RepID=A0A7J0EPC8_9ERIC|nr:tonoplast intrinsic protein 5;1 [Actinidia rufa]